MQVLTNRVPKPIPSAIESGRMVASSETCERCHERNKLGAIRLKIFRRHDEDEANTPEDTVLTMHVGGSKMGGIHGAHHGPGVQIRFVANDPKRQDIPLVEYENSVTDETRTYVRSDADAAAYADAPRITMQCIDCHNRAAHVFQPPDRAIDLALTLGLMSSSLPYLKSQGMEILTTTYESSAEAATRIPNALSDYYKEEYPETYSSRAEDVVEAGQALAQLYARNVFPELGVTWNTYVDNRGHTDDAPGCFRCHEGEHSTRSGEKIAEDCFQCHTASSLDETDPEILRSLGLKKPIDAMLKK